MANSKILNKTQKTMKEWDFKKGHMTLNFSVNVEVKTDLKDFRELLLEGIKAMDEEIKKHK